jgi:hypothetical protein
MMSLQGSLSIERMCQMVPVSRRGFYRSLQEQHPVKEETFCALPQERSVSNHEPNTFYIQG